jgi:diguanylate cyclase (GGDEF)-like protein/PAS domain S-box-containing protein
VAFEHSPAGSALFGPDGLLREVNDALVELLGFSREDMLGQPFTEATHPDDAGLDAPLLEEILAGRSDGYSLEKRFLCRDGRVVHALVHVGVIRSAQGDAQTLIGQVIDISERKLAEQRRVEQLTRDRLTGLLNHAGVTYTLLQRLADGGRPAVLYCDIDRLKTVNDSLGRRVGDDLLVAVARRLVAALPAEAIVARAGGDEFVVLTDNTNAEQAAALGEQLLAALREPFRVAGLRHTVSMTIGAACVRTSNVHAEDLLADAEQTMRRVKRDGGGRVEVHDPAQDLSGTVHDLRLEQELRDAVRTGEGLQVYLQPIIDIASEQVVGAESLVRWQRPGHGLLQPAEFLPLAEQTGIIVDLGWRVLDLGVRAAGHTLRAADATRPAGRPRWVAINVSGSQLARGLPDAVRRALAKYDVPARCVQLEITESELVQASDAALAELHDVAAQGISIALDDFGTGYSSLTLLRDLPINVVKIDRSFIAPIAENRRTATLVRSLVSMCKSLGISTVAEGIETPEQLALVRAIGCDRAQGFLFGEPVPVD